MPLLLPPPLLLLLHGTDLINLVGQQLEEEDAQGDYEQLTRDAAKKKSQMQETELDEKDAQGGCGQFTRDVAEEPVADSKSIAKKDCADDYGKPVDFCTKSQRWRDARGRFCRPPSPAR